jgi:DNA repair protein RadC
LRIVVGLKTPNVAARRHQEQRAVSQADAQMTKAIIEIAKPLGIAVHDHIIVGRNGHSTLKGMGLI